jgi:S-adenosylmethionine synthetase
MGWDVSKLGEVPDEEFRLQIVKMMISSILDSVKEDIGDLMAVKRYVKKVNSNRANDLEQSITLLIQAKRVLEKVLREGV